MNKFRKPRTIWIPNLPNVARLINGANSAFDISSKMQLYQHHHQIESDPRELCVRAIIYVYGSSTPKGATIVILKLESFINECLQHAISVLWCETLVSVGIRHP